MNRIIFLLEERSMKVLLEGLIPRLMPGIRFLCITHDGKHDLEKSIPRKLRGWREPGADFIILRDNDGGDCLELKNKLNLLCSENGRSDTLVRIACQELEAWYFGEPEALAEAFCDRKLLNIALKAPYRNPDAIQKPSMEIKKLVPNFQKVSGARRMSKFLTPTRNKSSSFRAFIKAVEKYTENKNT